MSYHGDIRLGDTIHLKFATSGLSGAPITLAGTPSISIYPGSSATQLGPATVASPANGITLTVDFDSVTGYHNVTIVATSGNGYATATNYAVMISAGTVDGISVANRPIGSFSIENRSAVMPTTAGRTAAIDASGRALADVDTIKTNPVVNAGTVTFPTTATLASTTNITGGTITTVGTLTTYTGNTPQTGDSFARIGALGAGLTAVVAASVTGAVGSVTGAVGSVTGNVGGNVVGTVGSVVGAVGSVTGAVGSVTAGVTLSTSTMTEAYAADGAAMSAPQALYMIWSMMAEKGIATTTLTANKLDGTTPAMTFTLDSATTPAAITRAS